MNYYLSSSVVFINDISAKFKNLFKSRRQTSPLSSKLNLNRWQRKVLLRSYLLTKIKIIISKQPVAGKPDRSYFQFIISEFVLQSNTTASIRPISLQPEGRHG